MGNAHPADLHHIQVTFSQTWLQIMAKIISLFNNKGGVGKTTTLWNLATSLSEKDKKVLVIDFDPQCNLSIAMLGGEDFAKYLNSSEDSPYGKTIRAFALPTLQQSATGKAFTTTPKCLKTKLTEATPLNNIDIVPGDFWLNNFSDVLSVGTDVIGGSGLYRFLLPSNLVNAIESEKNKNYDFVLIDLPPSFNTIVRSALYSSDYFIVPCTPDLYSAYCIGLIGQVLPNFIDDWEQGQRRYLQSNPYDTVIQKKGKPKFGGWIFNGYDTRKPKDSSVPQKLPADRAQFDKVLSSVRDNLLPKLKEISSYVAVPDFVDDGPIASIEDLNTMAPDSIEQSLPIKFLVDAKPTRNNSSRGYWSPNQKELMQKIDREYDSLAQRIIDNFQ